MTTKYFETYVNKQDADKIGKFFSSVNYSPTLMVFVGTGCNGKTTVMNELKNRFDNTRWIRPNTYSDAHLYIPEMSCTIVGINLLKDAEQFILAAKTLGHIVRIYEFSNTFN